MRAPAKRPCTTALPNLGAVFTKPRNFLDRICACRLQLIATATLVAILLTNRARPARKECYIASARASMAQSGQPEKNSVRAHIFRFAAAVSTRSMQHFILKERWSVI